MMNRKELINHLNGVIDDLREFDNYSGYQSMIRLLEEDIRLLIKSDDMWISVKEDRKPRHLQECLIAYVFGEDDSDRHWYGVERWNAFDGNGLVDRPHFSNEGVEGMRVTHWMEIPKLPK